VKIEMIKKTQSGATLEMNNLGKRSGATDTSISNRIEEIEERILA
jgi:DNA-binding Lrp family transcriptional regulator